MLHIINKFHEQSMIRYLLMMMPYWVWVWYLFTILQYKPLPLLFNVQWQYCTIFSHWVIASSTTMAPKWFENISLVNGCNLRLHATEVFWHSGTLQTGLLWSPYVIGQTIIFLPCSFFLSSIFFFYSLPNLSGRRFDVYHTLTHGVALVRI